MYYIWCTYIYYISKHWDPEEDLPDPKISDTYKIKEVSKP